MSREGGLDLRVGSVAHAGTADARAPCRRQAQAPHLAAHDDVVGAKGAVPPRRLPYSLHCKTLGYLIPYKLRIMKEYNGIGFRVYQPIVGSAQSWSQVVWIECLFISSRMAESQGGRFRCRHSRDTGLHWPPHIGGKSTRLLEALTW